MKRKATFDTERIVHWNVCHCLCVKLVNPPIDNWTAKETIKRHTMYNYDFDTLSQAINMLTKDGYKEDFVAGDTKIIAIISKKEYLPDELKIVDSFRFDGMTNPQDDSVVFAIEANDGTKGTLVMSYSASHSLV